MKKLHYTITTLEPLIITQHSDDPNMYETLQYIRGTVVQGVFAQNYLKSKIADSEFTRLIVSGDCIFSNAFPSENEKTYTPAPLALVREKYNQGLAHNLLVPETNKDIQTKGISSLICVESNQISPLTIRKEIRLHNQIDDNKRTTESGKLFNYQSLPIGMVFKGAITIKNEIDKVKIQSLIGNGDNIRIGRSATSEYGKVCFEWIESTEEEELPDSGQVIMTLLSDAIIYNENGFSSLVPEDINQYLAKAKIEKSISRKARIEGFLNVWKLRKPSENVFAAGSSFLLNQLPTNSMELVNLGLGERTHEGYGQVSFSLLSSAIKDFVYGDWQKAILTKPTVMPQLTNDILIAINFKRAKEQVVNKALEHANNTKSGISSNHLLGRMKDIINDPEMDINLKKFSDFLTNLRPTAKNHLTSAYLGDKDLVKHFEAILSGNTVLYEPKYGFEPTKQNLKELNSLYFEQYFNQLRRRNINKEKNETR